MRWRSKRSDDDFAAEIRTHIELEADELTRQGVPEREARDAAYRAFGNVTITRERFHDSQRIRWLPRQLVSDLRQAASRLLRQRVFAIAMMLTMALGIGANLSVFLIADAALFQSGPLKDLERIVVLKNADGTYSDSRDSRAVPDLLDLERDSGAFEAVASYAHGAGNLVGANGAERVAVTLATPDFFNVLHFAPIAGRSFLPSERIPRNANAAIISNALWHRDFGAAQNVIGRQLQLSGKSYDIVGVMPPEFQFPGETDVWIPLTVPFDPSQVSLLRIALIETVVARLKPDVSREQAQLSIDAMSAMISPGSVRRGEDDRVTVASFRSQLAHGNRDGIALLASMALLVLLIAIANASNLVMARASARLEEIRLCVALGATPKRIYQQLMTEPLLLTFVGGGTGLIIAYWFTHVMVATGTLPKSELGEVHFGIYLGALAIGISVFGGALAGGASAVILSRQAHLPPSSVRGGSSRMSLNARRYILGVQIAFSFALLVGASLVIRSLATLLDHDAEMPSDTWTAEMSLPPATYTNGVIRSKFAGDLLDRIRMIPGVRNAAIIDNLPLGGGAEVSLPVRISESKVQSAEPKSINVDLEVVSPGYFQTMGVSVERGRDFREADGFGAPLVALISEEMMTRYWPVANPVGATVTLEGDPRPRTIVGVVRGVRSYSLGQEIIPQVYFPYSQSPTTYFAVVASTTMDADRITAAIRHAVRGLDDRVPMFKVRTFGQVRRDSVVPQRSRAMLLGAFGFLALILSTIGVYGAAAYQVAQRQLDIGIRRALGATAFQVFRGVVVETLVPVVFGILGGACIAVALGRVMGSVLYGIGPYDPATFATVCIGLSSVAIAASSIPAWRATQISPDLAIRSE